MSNGLGTSVKLDDMAPKRKVLVLGSPLDYVDKDYLDKFEDDYIVDVSQCNNSCRIGQWVDTFFRFSTQKTVPRQKRHSPTKSPQMDHMKHLLSKWGMHINQLKQPQVLHTASPQNCSKPETKSHSAQSPTNPTMKTS